MADRSCGSCTLCCKLLRVPEIDKPAGAWCGLCRRDGNGSGGRGCGDYAGRPPSCRNFECFWLIDGGFPEELRPDRCGIVIAFNEDPDSVVLHVDPDRPDALLDEPAAGLVPILLRHYRQVCIACGDERAVIERDAGTEREA
jgi:hypothetical protein